MAPDPRVIAMWEGTICPRCQGPMEDGIHVHPFAACLFEDEEPTEKFCPDCHHEGQCPEGCPCVTC